MSKLNEIKQHWENWAQTFGQDIKATTRAAGIKKLEIQAIIDAIESRYPNKPNSMLEAGCGNGANCIAMSQYFNSAIDGFDYIPEMVEAAKSVNQSDSVRFFQGDVTKVDEVNGLLERYDLVFTCRCLINLPEPAQKLKAIEDLMARVGEGGYLMLLENFTSSFELQNDFRETLDLERRTVAEFNVFFDDDWFKGSVSKLGWSIDETIHFSGIHDLIQYSLIPATNEGKVDYDHSITEKLIDLQLTNKAFRQLLNMPVGQNRLVVLKKQ